MSQTTSYVNARSPQPSPVAWEEGREPTPDHWRVIAATWLLAAWAPPGAPGWTCEPLSGRTLPRGERQWAAPPTPEEIGEAAGLAGITGVDLLLGRVASGPGTGYRATRAPEEVAEEVEALIREFVGTADGRAGLLVRRLARQWVGEFTDVLRLTTGEDDALHLLRRDFDGATSRLTLRRAPGAGQPPLLAADGADGAPRTRIACVLTMLDSLLMVNNNDSVGIVLRQDRLDEGTDDPLAGAARWYGRLPGGNDHGEGDFDTIPAARPRSWLPRALLLGLAEGENGEDGGWPEELAEEPDFQLAVRLLEELTELVLRRMGGAPFAAVAGLSEEDGHVTLLLVHGDEVAALELSELY
ncbi:hypothetical protein [Streptomyces sedi]|uniref:Uncharacterized protein n=1 Tax=Streptomyces sedi TaxID=555059 RepID=A0A5C4UUW5_9ACTN|nr:hypothetical protein [Streptomyces sedi]TNM27285.1 hypothetical protein FH715_21570 [Streptomyces sedi]